jgi:hypothetical protein
LLPLRDLRVKLGAGPFTEAAPARLKHMSEIRHAINRRGKLGDIFLFIY